MPTAHEAITEYMSNNSLNLSTCLHRASFDEMEPLLSGLSVNRVPACMAGVKAGCIHLCRVAGNTVWSHMASDTP